MIKNPELLRKRLNARERENEQKWVLLFSGLMFIAGVNPAMLLTKIQFNNIIPTNGNTLFPKKNNIGGWI